MTTGPRDFGYTALLIGTIGALLAIYGLATDWPSVFHTGIALTAAAIIMLITALQLDQGRPLLDDGKEPAIFGDTARWYVPGHSWPENIGEAKEGYSRSADSDEE